MTSNRGKRNGHAEPTYAGLAGRLGTEAIGFVSERIRKDLAAGQAALGCRDFKALADVQRGWLQEAVDDYAEQTRKVLKLTTDVLGGAGGRHA